MSKPKQHSRPNSDKLAKVRRIFQRPNLVIVLIPRQRPKTKVEFKTNLSTWLVVVVVVDDSQLKSKLAKVRRIFPKSKFQTCFDLRHDDSNWKSKSTKLCCLLDSRDWGQNQTNTRHDLNCCTRTFSNSVVVVVVVSQNSQNKLSKSKSIDQVTVNWFLPRPLCTGRLFFQLRPDSKNLNQLKVSLCTLSGLVFVILILVTVLPESHIKGIGSTIRLAILPKIWLETTKTALVSGLHWLG
jgi:hypothetical protein